MITNEDKKEISFIEVQGVTQREYDEMLTELIWGEDNVKIAEGK